MAPYEEEQDRSALNRLLSGVSRHWFLVLNVLLGIWVLVPWLAPLFMELNWTGAGRLIYLAYAPQCHQMPQRSFFLFGDKLMYSLNEIQAVYQDTNNPLVLRRFVGNPEMGWKVAWSDRMVAMYSTIPLFGLLYWPLRRRVRGISLWILALLFLPMAIDGSTHLLSDFLGGIGGGFRYHNEWLATLTNHAFPATFYAGDAPGSFNSWMRLLSGLLFGLGVVWFVYPRLDDGFQESAPTASVAEPIALTPRHAPISSEEPG